MMVYTYSSPSNTNNQDVYFPNTLFSFLIALKVQCHEIFAAGFFYESVSPQPQSVLLGPFRIFSKIRGDIRSSRLTTGVADTGGKWKNLQSEKY